MSEITYIFGAGASYYSMPLVENFPKRFEYFMSYISNSEKIGNKAHFLQDCEYLLNNVTTSLSFDTFFKKLFHKKEYKTIEKNKGILLIYFMFEHMVDVILFSEDDFEIFKQKKSVKDPRYEALIAGLLKPQKDTNEFFVKTNFITWNYDLNLLSSLNDFLFDKEGLNDLIERFMRTVNHIVLRENVDIIHLNGLLNHPQMKSVVKLSKDSLELLLNNLVDSYINPDAKIFWYSNQICFSWESIANNHLEEMPLHIQNAKKLVLKSDIIVIVGYSFPLYNRIVDTYILNKETLKKKTLVLQDPNAEELKEIINADFNIQEQATNMHDAAEITNIKTLKNCNSFFVPNNVFV